MKSRCRDATINYPLQLNVSFSSLQSVLNRFQKRNGFIECGWHENGALVTHAVFWASNMLDLAVMCGCRFQVCKLRDRRSMPSCCRVCSERFCGSLYASRLDCVSANVTYFNLIKPRSSCPLNQLLVCCITSFIKNLVAANDGDLCFFPATKFRSHIRCLEHQNGVPDFPMRPLPIDKAVYIDRRRLNPPGIFYSLPSYDFCLFFTKRYQTTWWSFFPENSASSTHVASLP